MGNPRKSFDVQVKFVEEIMPFVSGKFEIAGSIPTESNVNFKVINKLLVLHNLKELDEKYERSLNKLLKFRNCVAHGDNSIPVKNKDVSSFTQLVTDLMSDLFEHITCGFKERSYLN